MEESGKGLRYKMKKIPVEFKRELSHSFPLY
jgi:hypothetical protein